MALALGTTVVVGCQQDQEQVTQPPDGADGGGALSVVAALTCSADLNAQSLSCGRRQLETAELGPQFLIVGGQNVFVQLVSDSVSYNPTTQTFEAKVRVANLLGDALGVGQPLGTPDGSLYTGVRVFFHSGPTVTGGTGSATVSNADGTRTFTGANQPYFQYDYIIPPGFITPRKTWHWQVDNTVTTFQFEVFVEADVPHPNGFVQMSPEATATTVGGHVTIVGAIRDVVNRAVSGTVTYSSSDESIATVNSTTGEVTGVAPGTVNIIAHSSGSEDDGIATVMIPSASFHIQLRYLTAATATQQQAFDDAAARWESILTGDLSNVLLNTQQQPFCSGVPVNEVIDDVRIDVILGPIDGVNGILGQAGPCAFRSSNDLPAFGRMEFDTDDLDAIEADNQLEDVVLHEMGHVLGFGTLWSASHLDLRLGTGTSDPRFIGSNAINAYIGKGGTGSQCNPPSINTVCVPLEGIGGSGTVDTHWREASCGTCQSTDFFGNELMTGYISAPGDPNPLSIVTISQFIDEGYPGVVTTDPDDFTLNPTLPPAPPGAKPRLKLVNDIWLGPLYRIESDGSLTMVLPDRR